MWRWDREGSPIGIPVSDASNFFRGLLNSLALFLFRRRSYPLSAYLFSLPLALSLLVRGRPLSLSASTDLDRLAAEAGIPAEYSQGVHSEVIEEMPQLATRLHVKNAEIYGRYDRLVAEGTFRLNVAIPLTLFLSVLAFRTGLAWWSRALLVATAVVFGLLLAGQGMRRVVAARDILVQAISIPDLELDSRRLKDFPWRLESIRAVQDAIGSNLSPTEDRSGHEDSMREAVVRILRDRRDLLSRLVDKSPRSPAPAKDPSDSELLALFLDATRSVDNDLKGGDTQINQDTARAVDQVLHQLDQIDSSNQADL